MSETKPCPVCGKEIKTTDTTCSFKCFRIINGINKPEEKAHVKRKNIKMSERDYKLNRSYKCRNCKKKFETKSRLVHCPKCDSSNIKQSSSSGCECLYILIILPIVIFFTIIGIM